MAHLLPLRLFRVPASQRDDASFRRLVALALEIWAQADIQLDVTGDIFQMRLDPTRTIADLLAADDGEPDLSSGCSGVFAAVELQTMGNCVCIKLKEREPCRSLSVSPPESEA